MHVPRMGTPLERRALAYQRGRLAAKIHWLRESGRRAVGDRVGRQRARVEHLRPRVQELRLAVARQEPRRVLAVAALGAALLLVAGVLTLSPASGLRKGLGLPTLDPFFDVQDASAPAAPPARVGPAGPVADRSPSAGRQQVLRDRHGSTRDGGRGSSESGSRSRGEHRKAADRRGAGDEVRRRGGSRRQSPTGTVQERAAPEAEAPKSRPVDEPSTPRTAPKEKGSGPSGGKPDGKGGGDAKPGGGRSAARGTRSASPPRSSK